jgi:hypothetical protein
MPVGARLVIAVLVAGWTVTFAILQTEESANGMTNESWACGDIRNREYPSDLAAEVEVEGVGCGEARSFVRRLHRACGVENCQLEGYECVIEDERSASCERGPEARVRWVWIRG